MQSSSLEGRSRCLRWNTFCSWSCRVERPLNQTPFYKQLFMVTALCFHNENCSHNFTDARVWFSSLYGHNRLTRDLLSDIINSPVRRWWDSVFTTAGWGGRDQHQPQEDRLCLTQTEMRPVLLSAKRTGPQVNSIYRNTWRCSLVYKM